MGEEISAVHFQIIPENSVPFEYDPIIEKKCHLKNVTLPEECSYELLLLRAKGGEKNDRLIEQNKEVGSYHDQFIYLANCFENPQRTAGEWASISGLLRQYSKNRIQTTWIIKLLSYEVKYNTTYYEGELERIVDDNERIIEELKTLIDNLRRRKDAKT